jgi:hypothetical protein
MRYRVRTTGRSFDVQKFYRIDKDGQEIWENLAYFRSKAALQRYLKANDLPMHIADRLPRYHPDCAVAANQFVVSQIEAEIVAAAISDRKRAELALKKAPPGGLHDPPGQK